MMETLTEIFTSGEIWSIIIKALLTAAAGGIIALCGTLLGKIISKNKESRIYKYARTLVDAAEQKYPNEGTKMGPQKMSYVMDQIVIRFPGVKDNRYLYNIVEQAVYKLNEEKQRQKAIEEFEKKYGEGSYVDMEQKFDEGNAEQLQESNDYVEEQKEVHISNVEVPSSANTSVEKDVYNNNKTSKQVVSKKSGGLKSF